MSRETETIEEWMARLEQEVAELKAGKSAEEVLEEEALGKEDDIKEKKQEVGVPNSGRSNSDDSYNSASITEQEEENGEEDYENLSWDDIKDDDTSSSIYGSSDSADSQRPYAESFQPFNVEQEKEKYQARSFKWAQYHEIELGFQDGLSPNQVAFYAKECYDRWQMRELRKGLMADLTFKQLSLYSDPVFDDHQMFEIRTGLASKLKTEKVAFYADSKYSAKQMRELRLGFEQGLDMETVQAYGNEGLTSGQMAELRKAASCGLSTDEIRACARTDLNPLQIRELCLGYRHGLYASQVSAYSSGVYTPSQMRVIRTAMETEEAGLAPKGYNTQKLLMECEGACRSIYAAQGKI